MSSPTHTSVLSLVKSDSESSVPSVVTIRTTYTCTPSTSALLCSSPGECDKCAILENKLQEMSAIADKYKELYQSVKQKSESNSEQSIKIIKEVYDSLDRIKSIQSSNASEMISISSSDAGLVERSLKSNLLSAFYATRGRGMKRKERDE